MTKPRIVLVDDHDILRAGAAKCLGDDFEVVGEAGDVDEAVEAIVAADPDGVLLDVHLPSGSGAEVVRAGRDADIDCRFICLSVSAGSAGCGHSASSRSRWLPCQINAWGSLA